MTTPSRNKAFFVSSAVLWLASPACWAGTTPPFDIGGLILYGALYLFGLVVFPFVIGCSKEKKAKRFWSWLLAVYVVGPATYIFAEIKSKEMRNARIADEVKAGQQKNLEAFGNYCKERKRIVHSKGPQEGGVSLLVRIEKDFTGVRWQFNAYPLFEYFGKHPNVCGQTGVKVLEGLYDGAYSKERNGYEKEVRRYAMCTNERWAVIPEVQSRFELVLGQTGSKDSVPWGGAGSRWMSKSSVQIVDRLTGKILAEDTMYFLRYDTGEGGCPEGISQLSDLLAEVFGRQ